MTQVLLKIPDDTHSQAKIQAIEKGYHLKDYLVELIIKGVKKK